MSQPIALSNNLTMSSREIADLTGKQHSNVLRDIKNMMEELKRDDSVLNDELYHGYTDEKDGRGYISIIRLNRHLTETLVTGYSVILRSKVIQRLHELEAQQTPKPPGNYVEALEALLAAEKEKQLALEKIEAQQRAIEVKNQQIIASNEASIKAGEILVREFVKSNDLIDIGEKQFFKWMRDKKILMASNEPYQTYVKRGFFTWKPTEEIHGGAIRYQLRVTPRGKVWLAAKYLSYLDNDLAA